MRWPFTMFRVIYAENLAPTLAKTMFEDHADPRQLAFWRRRLMSQTLDAALNAYPEQAARIFGAAPIKRRNMFELAMILGAREILAAPSGDEVFNGPEFLEREERAIIDQLSGEERELAAELFSPENREEASREFARRIIEEATGMKPD
jgi:hypothetical protein